MNKALKNKLTTLPKSPGIYFHKNNSGEIIYIGKAAVLKNRVSQYFQTSRYRDPKTDLLVSEIADIDWVELKSETEALFLEAELIKRYLPKYNILLRDDKSNVYVRINTKDTAPNVTIVRHPIDDGAEYFGPYLQAELLKKALRYLRKIFPYSTHTVLPERACLQYHLGLCPGPETTDYIRTEYIKNLNKLILIIRGKHKDVISILEKDMAIASRKQNFEHAAILRNRLYNLKSLQKQVIFGDRESMDLSKDYALADLMTLLGLNKPPRRIEGYDISHLQGTDNVASMVVFEFGTPNKPAYRKFKMRLSGNNDFAHITEVIERRISKKNQKQWSLPDLILIDGGKGQLSAAAKILSDAFIKIPIIGLAKRTESIIVDNNLSNLSIDFKYLNKIHGFSSESENVFTVIELPLNSHIIKLLQRVRDESHRFAISYHTLLTTSRQSSSRLDDIPGIGPQTKRKLLKKFGSLKAIKLVSGKDLSDVVGESKSKIIKTYL